MRNANHHDAPNPLKALIAGAGGRLTHAREQIFACIQSSPRPLSIGEIARQVSANETSVYRAIDYFLRIGLIEEIAYPDGVRRFACGGHHHHIICSHCGHTEHIPCDHSSPAPLMVHPAFQAIARHEITYYGTCTACAK